MAQTMLPASKSSGVQYLSESRVARLIYAMGCPEPSGLSCSNAEPKLSMQASQYVGIMWICVKIVCSSQQELIQVLGVCVCV